jgi:hypothetical protein
VDVDGYSADIISELVKTPLYETQMCKRITDLYGEMYRTKLETHDLQYMFQCIQQKRIDIKSAAIGENISSLYTETQKYTKAMKQVYTTILNRDPDALEYVHQLQVYRDASDVLTTDSRLREELYSGFEYHDILKSRIREVYNDMAKKEMLPSQQFAVLKEVLQSDTVMRDPVALRNCVRVYFGLPEPEPTPSSASTNKTSGRPDIKAREDKK